MLERIYQAKLIKKLCQRFPGIMVIKLDAQYIQGIPDLLLLLDHKWAMLESKRSRLASMRPNQEYYVDLLNRMSFAAFISPENEAEVLDDLQIAFESACGDARIS